MQQAISPKETPTGGIDQTAGEKQNDQQIIGDDWSEKKPFAALVTQASRTGRTLQKIATGYVLKRGSSSLHFSDFHTAEELIVRMKRHQPDSSHGAIK